MVVEIPRWSNAKLEISSKLPFNPIVQDSKKGKLRYVANVFPFKGFLHTYGALPQTWEDPNKVDQFTGYKGDNDPLDILEIGSGLFNSLTNNGFGPKPYTGQVKQVKILGCLGMIDEGETDWKILAIDTKDPLCEAFNDIGDVNNSFPTLVGHTRDWFKYYKVPDGKGINTFAFNGEAKNKEFAMKIIEDCHQSWVDLISQKGSETSITLKNTTIKDSSGYNISFELSEEFVKVEEHSAQSLDKFHYISRNE
ncbi:inorganic pyrophosphatase [Nadsonia fulvescens var. elongata DSM 6958]|uniref:inorganic diphosphatase n=1 Tax=Nadsonia fulvescens var. elongata DSM 6958 TaxID=857566 RepID=A0A1E3PE49_9ASCO|nr:inorganic pyrophosphatase [Nadsonia fulvescens var. elongata DSM 6958]